MKITIWKYYRFSIYNLHLHTYKCAIAQAVNSRLPTMAVLVHVRGKSSMGSVVARVALVQVFSKYFCFHASDFNNVSWEYRVARA
jgi:hypothetical protein